MKLSLKAKSWISVALFIAVFAALVIVATFYDLQISRIMTAGALSSGEYIGHDVFGVLGEIIGTSPVFLLVAFIGAALFWYFMKIWKIKPLKYIFAVAFFAIGVVGFYLFVNDVVSYTLWFAGNKKFASDGAVIVSMVFVALLFNFLLATAMKDIKEETIKALARFAVVALVALAVANLVIHFIKGPVGRWRFRTMNSELGQSYGGFDNYTAWYVMNGQPPQDILDLFETAYGVSDSFKSFPSGHTCAAGMSYAIILLPSVLKLKNKGAKAVCWIVPIVFTGLVGASRIVIGAHYLSDVTFGGTIAFLSMIIFKEIFLDKCIHVKAMFGKSGNITESLMEEQINA